MSKKKKILTVIPSYNERANVEPLVDSLMALPLDIDVMYMDDNSPDGTAERVKEVAAKYPNKNIEAVVRTSNKGFAASYIDGFTRAAKRNVDLVCQMDADGQHPCDAILSMVEEIEKQDADLVVASRYVSGGGTGDWATLRKLISEYGGFYSRRMLNMPYQDLTGGFKLWRRELLAQMPLDQLQSEKFSIQIETTSLAHRMGAKIIEVPFTFEVRTEGDSNMSAGVMLEGLLRVLWWAIFPISVPRFAKSGQ